NAEPGRIERLAARVIRSKPGSESAVARALTQVVLAENLARGNMAASITADYRARFTNDTPEQLAETLGLDANELQALAREIAGSNAAVILYDEMTTREVGNETLAADAFELALLTDNVTRSHAGVGP